MPADTPAAETLAAPTTASLTLKDVTSAQWHAFLAAFGGWLLDGFDFSILTFVLIDIERSFTVDKALAGMLGTVTLMFRLVGGLGVGTAADRFGRKTPLILSIVWISLFSLLSGFSVNYAMLFACRALFGIGMGGVWAAGLPLALEHWPQELRGVVSGMLMGGFNWGYIFAALVFQVLYPTASHVEGAWRHLFWVAASPVLLVLLIWYWVKESPLWLERRNQLARQSKSDGLSALKIFGHDLIKTTTQTTLLMSVFMFSYYSVSFWYPTFLRQKNLAPLQYLIALNVGGIAGHILWGRISETNIGRRGAIALAAIGGVAAVPIFVVSHSASILLVGALLMGVCGMGAWGMAPSYLAERFPTAARAVGPGFAYHAGAAVGSLTPTSIGMLQDRGVNLGVAMGVCIAIAGLLLATIVWVGPETKGQRLTAAE